MDQFFFVFNQNICNWTRKAFKKAKSMLSILSALN